MIAHSQLPALSQLAFVPGIYHAVSRSSPLVVTPWDGISAVQQAHPVLHGGHVTRKYPAGVSAATRGIRLFGGQRQQHMERFRDASQYNRVQNLKLAFADGLSTPVIQTLPGAVALAAWSGSLSPTSCADSRRVRWWHFLTAATQLGKPIRQLSGVQSDMQDGRRRGISLHSSTSRKSRTTAATRVARTAGISVCAVYRLPTGAIRPRYCLDVSIGIPAGKTVALVGRSGSGKTPGTSAGARFTNPAGRRSCWIASRWPVHRLANLHGRNWRWCPSTWRCSTIRYTTISPTAHWPVGARMRCWRPPRSAYARQLIGLCPGFQTVLGDDGNGLSGSSASA